MSYYGFTAVPKDYSYIAKAGEAIGRMGAAGYQMYTDKVNMDSLKDRYTQLIDTGSDALINSCGYDEQKARSTMMKYYLPPLKGEQPQDFVNRLQSMDTKFSEFFKGEYEKSQQNQLSSSFSRGTEETRHIGNIGGALGNMNLHNDYSDMRRSERGNNTGMLQVSDSSDINPQGRVAEMGVNGLQLQTPKTPYTNNEDNDRQTQYEPVIEKFNRPYTSEEMAGIRNKMGVSPEVSKWADEHYINPQRNLESLNAIGDKKEQFAALGKALVATGGILTPEIKEMVKTLPNANTVANNERYIYLGDAKNGSAEKIAAGHDEAGVKRAQIGANAGITKENIKAASKSDAKGAAADDKALNSLRTNIRQIAEKIAKCGGKVEEIYGNGGKVAIRDLNKIVLANNPGAMQSLNTELKALYNTLNIYLAELNGYNLTEAQKKSIDELDRQVKEIISRSASAPVPVTKSEKPKSGPVMGTIKAVGNFFSGDSQNKDEPKQTDSGFMF